MANILARTIVSDLRDLARGTYRTFRTNPVELSNRISYLVLADAVQRRFTFAGIFDQEAEMDTDDILDLDLDRRSINDGLAAFLRTYRHARPANRQLCTRLREMFFGGYGVYDRSEVEVRPVRRAGRSPELPESSFENLVRANEDAPAELNQVEA